MSRMLRIFKDEEGGNSLFLMTKDDDAIKCAFDSKSFCSPLCAAFTQRQSKLWCERNGTDNEFNIGHTND